MENIKKRTSSQPVFFRQREQESGWQKEGDLVFFPPPRSPRHDQPFLVGGFPWGRFSIFPAGLFLAPKQFFFAKCYLSSMALSLGAPPPQRLKPHKRTCGRPESAPLPHRVLQRGVLQPHGLPTGGGPQPQLCFFAGSQQVALPGFNKRREQGGEGEVF